MGNCLVELESRVCNCVDGLGDGGTRGESRAGKGHDGEKTQTHGDAVLKAWCLSVLLAVAWTSESSLAKENEDNDNEHQTSFSCQVRRASTYTNPSHAMPSSVLTSSNPLRNHPRN